MNLPVVVVMPVITSMNADQFQHFAFIASLQDGSTIWKLNGDIVCFANLLWFVLRDVWTPQKYGALMRRTNSDRVHGRERAAGMVALRGSAAGAGWETSPGHTMLFDKEGNSVTAL